VFEDTPLEVVLVNARSNEKPEKARPLPSLPAWPVGVKLAKGAPPRRCHRPRVTESGERHRRSRPAAPSSQPAKAADHAAGPDEKPARRMPPPEPQRTNPTAEQVEREEKRRQLVKLLAEIERRINEENARPKKRYVSPATREAVYAVYYDNLRRKIEDKGTRTSRKPVAKSSMAS
jgi:protein TonB